jgi:putative flippase GtrA
MNQMEGALPAKSRQSLRQRVLLFVFAGPVLNYLLIAGSYNVFSRYQLPLAAVSACSVGVSSIVFFFWNYFLNFRTDSRKRHAFGRYVVAVIVLWAVTSAILYGFKTFNANMKFSVWRFSLDLDVVATQACFGWIKFLVYRHWVFPAQKEAGPA